MMSHPLFDALVQPSRPLPAHFRAAGVGMPKALPRLLQFGPVAPPQVGGSQFTGGRVSQPQTSLAHPEAAQGFTPPHFNPSNPTAPSLAPFVSTPQGGPPTGPPFSMGGAPTGATAPPEPPAPPQAPGLVRTNPTFVPPGSPPSLVRTNPTFVPPSLPPSTHPPTQGGISTGGYTNTAQVLAALLGAKLNPSGGNLRYYT